MTLGRSGLIPHAVVKHLPYLDDVGGIATNQSGRDLVVQQVDQRRIGAGAAGRILTLAPADQPVVCLDAQDRGVECLELTEIAAMLPARLDRDPDPPCLCRLDPHRSRPSGSAAGASPP